MKWFLLAVLLSIVAFASAVFSEQVLKTIGNGKAIADAMMVEYDPWSRYALLTLALGLPIIGGLITAARPRRLMKKIMDSTKGKLTDEQYAMLIELGDTSANTMIQICVLTAIFTVVLTAGVFWSYTQLFCR
jgi:hypothetical protein